MSTLDEIRKGLVTMYKVQISTGSISFLASLAMAAGIQFSKGALTTPYRRLVYGLCVSDIIQSLSIITGPFAVTAGAPFSFWALGNITSCTLNGFMFSAGFTAIPMYVLALGVYYLFKLKRRMSDQVFWRKYEVWIHSFIILWHLVTNSIILAFKSFNPEISGSYCFPNEYPSNCDTVPERVGVCIRGENARILSAVFLFTPVSICFISIIICTLRLMCHAYTMLKLSPPPRKNKRSRRTIAGSKPANNNGVSDREPPTAAEGEEEKEKGMETVENPPENDAHVSAVEELSLLYKREMLIQGLSFIGVFFLNYFLPAALGIMNLRKETPTILFLTVLSGLYPLGGILNIIVHTRPNIAALRRREGYQGSWPRAFLQVLLAGGDIPELEQRSVTANGGLPGTDGPPSFMNFGARQNENVGSDWSNENVVSYKVTSDRYIQNSNQTNSSTDNSNIYSFNEANPSTASSNMLSYDETKLSTDNSKRSSSKNLNSSLDISKISYEKWSEDSA